MIIVPRIRAVACVRAAICALLCLHALSTVSLADPTSEIANKYKPVVVQIKILQNSSRTKASIGSGFFVTTTGHIITNYHVVAQLIQYPSSYQGECVFADGSTRPLTLLDIDVVHDLALVKVDIENPAFLSPEAVKPSQGERVFAMGNPHDLGFTLVDGVYNGLLEDSMYEKIHFTGSLNPGMSGGPAISSSGKLVGVNVATSGNQVSFLVPAKYVTALVNRKQEAADQVTVDTLTARIAEQLTKNQESYIEKMLASSTPRVHLDTYQAPGQISPAFKCWSRSNEDEERPYELLSYMCSTQDEIFLSDAHETGMISFFHVLVSSSQLNRFQFFSLYERLFEGDPDGLSGQENDLTNFRCKSGFVKTGGISFKTGLCVRGFKRMHGLYDVVLKAASVMSNDSGLQTTLTLSGVSFENAQKFIAKYLQDFEWNQSL